jgi:secreted PhoX family phosphatase
MLDRRRFTLSSIASLALAGYARSGFAQGGLSYDSEVRGFGSLRPDPNGILDLPQDFSYSVLSRFGEMMDDGFAVPDSFDGMGCIGLGRNRVALIRNHELKPGQRNLGPSHARADLERRLASAPHFGRDAQDRVLPGGTTTIIFNLRSGRREKQFLSLAGTTTNCAGGVTPWGSWLSCEEAVTDRSELAQSHGWVFEVSGAGAGLAAPTPIEAMGRFRHEAAAVDPRTGIVYLTEDRDDSLFYRFLPADRRHLLKGGKLQALAFVGQSTADTRNWTSQLWTAGSKVPVRWLDLDEVDSPKDDLRSRGAAQGAAIFARGEGIHFGDGELFFTCTSGGAAKLGQVLRYRPSRFEGRLEETSAPAQLELFVESRDPRLLDYGDNLTVTPWGHLIICEDRKDGKPNHLRGITAAGKIYTFARLNMDTELAGICFSPDGRTMFVNAYSPGRTLAIRGPWGRVSDRPS